MKINPGGDPNTYLTLKDKIHHLEEEVVGHVMIDEIKLKNGIAYNCNNSEVSGFAIEQMNTKTMFENILSMNKKQ